MLIRSLKISFLYNKTKYIYNCTFIKMSNSNNSSTNSSINSGSDNTNTISSGNEKNKLIFQDG